MRDRLRFRKRACWTPWRRVAFCHSSQACVRFCASGFFFFFSRVDRLLLKLGGDASVRFGPRVLQPRSFLPKIARHRQGVLPRVPQPLQVAASRVWADRVTLHPQFAAAIRRLRSAGASWQVACPVLQETVAHHAAVLRLQVVAGPGAASGLSPRFLFFALACSLSVCAASFAAGLGSVVSSSGERRSFCASYLGRASRGFVRHRTHSIYLQDYYLVVVLMRGLTHGQVARIRQLQNDRFNETDSAQA